MEGSPWRRAEQWKGRMRVWGEKAWRGRQVWSKTVWGGDRPGGGDRSGGRQFWRARLVWGKTVWRGDNVLPVCIARVSTVCVCYLL